MRTKEERGAKSRELGIDDKRENRGETNGK